MLDWSVDAMGLFDRCDRAECRCIMSWTILWWAAGRILRPVLQRRVWLSSGTLTPIITGASEELQHGNTPLWHLDPTQPDLSVLVYFLTQPASEVQTIGIQNFRGQRYVSMSIYCSRLDHFRLAHRTSIVANKLSKGGAWAFGMLTFTSLSRLTVYESSSGQAPLELFWAPTRRRSGSTRPSSGRWQSVADRTVPVRLLLSCLLHTHTHTRTVASDFTSHLCLIYFCYLYVSTQCTGRSKECANWPWWPHTICQ